MTGPVYTRAVSAEEKVEIYNFRLNLLTSGTLCEIEDGPLFRIRSSRSLIHAGCKRATTRFITVESAFFSTSRRLISYTRELLFAFEHDVRRENIAIIMRDVKREETREIPNANITADLLFQKYI